jgi:hypothetical protein
MKMKQFRFPAGFVVFLAACGPVSGAIDLEFRASTPVVDIGEQVAVQLVAVSDGSIGLQTLSAVEVVFVWDAADLSLAGLAPGNPANLIFTGFPLVGSGGLNELNPPQDGDGYYLGLGPLGTPVVATESGTLIATFVFEAISSTPAGSIDFLQSAGSPTVRTQVFDGQVPNTIVTGTLTGATVAVRCGPFDVAAPFGVLDLADVNAFVSGFVSANPVADLDNNGIFDLVDINLFISGFLQGCP